MSAASKPTGITVRVADGPGFAISLAIRRAVFVEEAGVPEDVEFDGLDGEADHRIALRDGRPVGTARLIWRGDTLKIGHIAVLSAHRGKGIGVALVADAIEAARQRGDVARIVLMSRPDAARLYQKLGFVAVGEPEEIAGTPHQAMELALTG